MIYMTYDHLMEVEVSCLAPVQRVIVRSCFERIGRLRFADNHLQADKNACFWRYELDWYAADRFRLRVYYPLAQMDAPFFVYPEKHDTRKALGEDFMCDLDWFDTRDIIIYPKPEMMCAAFYMTPNEEKIFADSNGIESYGLF